MSEPDGFLSRWARRKAHARSGIDTPAEAPASAVTVPDAAARRSSAAAGAPPRAVESVPAPASAPAPSRSSIAESTPLPTMEDVARLTRSSDVASVVQPGIDPGVSNAAMKKLFSDPRYNVMDGLDTYIGDYHTPDPIPLAMLRQMNQSKMLGLFADEDEPPVQTSRSPAADAAEQASPDGAAGTPLAQSDPNSAAPADALNDVPDENADLRLQQDDAAGRPGPAEGAGA